jgi:hypothetical protein
MREPNASLLANRETSLFPLMENGCCFLGHLSATTQSTRCGYATPNATPKHVLPMFVHCSAIQKQNMNPRKNVRGVSVHEKVLQELFHFLATAKYYTLPLP